MSLVAVFHWLKLLGCRCRPSDCGLGDEMFFATTRQPDIPSNDLAVIRRALRSEQRKLRRMRSRLDTNYGLTDETLLFCATVKELAPEQPEIARWAAVRSLADAREAEGCVRSCLIDDLIEEFRQQCSHRLGAQVEVNAANSNRRQRAADLIAQHRLMAWVSEVNRTRGIAPSSDHMLQRFRAFWSFGDQPDLMNTAEKLANGSPSGARRWFTDWRRRFGITFGKLPPGCDLSAEEIQNQVLARKWVPKMGSHLVPVFGDPSRDPRHVVPIFGAKNGTHFWNPENGKCNHM